MKFPYLNAIIRRFYYVSCGVIFIFVSLFSEKLQKKNHYPPPVILDVFDENEQDNFRALEAKGPMVTDQYGCDFWLFQTQKHGNQCCRQ